MIEQWIGKWVGWIMLGIALSGDKGFYFINWLVHLSLWNWIDQLRLLYRTVIPYDKLWIALFGIPITIIIYLAWRAVRALETMARK